MKESKNWVLGNNWFYLFCDFQEWALKSHEHLLILAPALSCVLRAYLLSQVWLCDPMDCSPPGSSVHGDSPGKNIGVAISSSKGSSWPKDRTQVSHIAGRFFTIWATQKARAKCWWELTDIIHQP